MIESKLRCHPCFHMEARGFMRMHLPVAPKCNIACKYCVRQYDCANENRPGVTSKVLTPTEAAEKYFQGRQELGERLSVVGISGPGDPLANWEEVSETFRQIRQWDQEVILCLSTNGMRLVDYAAELAQWNVNSVSVTVNAVSIETASKIYCSMDKTDGWFLEFMNRQWAGIAAARSHGIICKVNTVLVRGINETDAVKIAEKAASFGCDIQNLIPLIPLPGTGFDEKHVVSAEQLCTLQIAAAQYIRQMSHCHRCRADACGSL